MNVVPVLLPLPNGYERRYMASILTPKIVVTRMGISRLDAIINCLKEFNKRCLYDRKYL